MYFLGQSQYTYDFPNFSLRLCLQCPRIIESAVTVMT